MEFFDFAYYGVFAAFLGVLFFKRKVYKGFGYLFIYYTVTFANDFSGKILSYNAQENKNTLTILNKIYNILDVFTIIVFFLVYYRQLRNQKTLTAIFFITLFATLYYLVIGTQNYSVMVGMWSVSFLIITSLLWFYELVSKPDEIYIFRKPFFWISTALLFWSVFFIFRMMPMYWLSKNDLNLLNAIQFSFVIVNIITYSLMLKGVYIIKKNE